MIIKSELSWFGSTVLSSNIHACMHAWFWLLFGIRKRFPQKHYYCSTVASMVVENGGEWKPSDVGYGRATEICWVSNETSCPTMKKQRQRLEWVVLLQLPVVVLLWDPSLMRMPNHFKFLPIQVRNLITTVWS